MINMAVDSLARILAMANGGGKAGALTYKGSCLFADLPTEGMEQGDVWDILDEFILDGKTFPAGTNIAWNGTK